MATLRFFDATTRKPIGDPIVTGDRSTESGGVEPGRHDHRHRRR